METHPNIAHGRCKSATLRREPEFDAERVIWDADYRHRVMDVLRRWRLKQGRDADPKANDMNEMKAA
jgi:hypothetical protein